MILDILIGGEQKHQSIKQDGICTCLCSSMGTGGGYIPMLVETENRCKYLNIPQTVRIRKYKVEVDKLKKILKEHKCYSIKEIA